MSIRAMTLSLTSLSILQIFSIVLNVLPKTLDETYGHTLLSIDDEKREYAQRLFRCLAVSIRPLRVQELAEILAIQFGPISSPVFNADWRPIVAEEAVLSACSSLITMCTWRLLIPGTSALGVVLTRLH